jgi:hypothetical protein
MYENHAHEQYFFNEPTLQALSEFLMGFETPCCICAPLLGKTLADKNKNVRVLDIDSRFSAVPGFVYYDIYKPRWLGEEFDIIVCDPPFFNVSLSQLFHAIRMLSLFNFSQPLLLTYLTRRSSSILGTFQKFLLKPTGFFPGYQTVRKIEKNEIELYSNLEKEYVEKMHHLQNKYQYLGPAE